MHLRTILNVIVGKFDGTMVSISTRERTDGSIRTRIKGSTFYREYIPTKTMTLFEAEAVAICRFLRSMTHVLGYSVVDQNYPSLARLVADMNGYNERMAELRTCVDKAVGMIHSTHESIKDVHEMLTLQVPREEIEELSSSVGDLLSCIEGHWTAVNQVFTAFKQDEVCTASVYHTYRHTSVCDRLITCALGLAGTIQFSQAGDKVCKVIYSSFGEQVQSISIPCHSHHFYRFSIAARPWYSEICSILCCAHVFSLND